MFIAYLLPFILGFALGANAQDAQPQTETKAKIAVIMGLHKLVLDYKSTASRKAITQVAKNNWFSALLLAYRIDFWADVYYYIYQQKRSTEFAFAQLAEKYPRFAHFSDELLEAIYQHTLNPEAEAFIADLKKAGHTVIFATTAGPKMMALHTKKYPEFFANNTFTISDAFDDFRGNLAYWRKALALAPASSHTVAIERETTHQAEAESLGMEVIIAKNAQQARAEFEKRFGPLK